MQLLILANVCVFVLQLALEIPFGTNTHADSPGGQVLEWLAFNPDKFLSGLVWLPVTYIFLHSGLWHLFTNMLMLFFFRAGR